MMKPNDKAWDLAEMWQHYREPARPNQSEVNIVDINIKPNSEVLLLGSTPEYRDILSKKNCHVAIAEYNKDNFNAMTQLMHNIPFSEELLQVNWLSMNIEKKFDLIVGDHILNLIPPDTWPNFIYKLKSYLKPNAALLQRVITRPNTHDKTLKLIFENTKKISGEALFSQCFYDLIFMTVDGDNDSTTLKNVWRKIQEAHSNNLITDKQLAYFEKFSWENTFTNAFFTIEDKLLKSLKAEFKTNQIIKGKLYYNKFTYFIKSSN